MNLLLLIYLLSVAVRVLCDSSTPLFIVPYLDNECLTSYLQLSNLIYDTRSTMNCFIAIVASDFNLRFMVHP